ncbi:MAG: FAD-binding protein [Comamonadaceae bacterium]|nr:FAD-binding protein [Comamonadaceae bacterium]
MEELAQNIVHTMTIDGEYYFSPTSLAELQGIVRQAVKAGATVRVSGQRHAQPPLVAEDNRVAPSPTRWLIDLSCYKDLGSDGNQSIVLHPSEGTVTVNTGVREDELDAFLTANNMMLKTVTAGGFFSLGGMTAVDVHGATINAPIFAETVSAFGIMGPDGQVKTVNAQTPAVDGWSPLRFARLSRCAGNRHLGHRGCDTAPVGHDVEIGQGHPNYMQGRASFHRSVQDTAREP